ncbi:hypothetical protein MLD38_017004 [Melastoma candidum]|uniref:Uncharacterized protein n=1 Tax=Melastoma candidum TaxID=119954 RepID=A0ACB9QTB0_9MYRT|nr:hypothetical protein MLD38_017004 [Melastoma candidum]
MGRWRLPPLLLGRLKKPSSSRSPSFSSRSLIESFPVPPPPPRFPCSLCLPLGFFRRLSSVPRTAAVAADYVNLEESDHEEPESSGEVSIPVKAYFLCTSVDLRRLQAENIRNVLPHTSRSSNYIALKYSAFPSPVAVLGACHKASKYSYMVVCQYGSVILFNIDDDDVETYLTIVKRHATGLLPQMWKDDYAVKEKPELSDEMEGGPDYILLKNLDTDGIRVISSVLGQSIALDYFVSQIDSMVEEFAYINRKLESSGTFTMDRKKLLQLVGKANSNLADVILKVGLFERSEIAWSEAKYAQIYEYLREEYEVTQRFSNLNIKLKFVEHNIHFLHEVLQNKKSNLLEWCIIFLLSVENLVSIYEIIRESNQIPLS